METSKALGVRLHGLLMACSIAFTCILCGRAALADARWKADVVSGNWADAENWADGVVPEDAANVTIDCRDGDYDITISSNGTTRAWITTVGNASGATTLRIDSPLELFNETTTADYLAFIQRQGATTIVSAGGALRLVNVKSGSRESNGAGLNIANSTFIVDGGVVDLNNGNGIHLSGTADVPTALIITNGGSVAWWRTGETYGNLSMADNTRIHVHDGCLAVNQNHNWYGWPYKITGGEMLFSGTGVFSNMFTRGTTTYGNFPFTLRGGIVTFKDYARFVQQDGISGRNIYLLANANGTAEMSFEGQSQLTGTTPYRVVVGGGGLGSSTALNWRSSSDVYLASQSAIIGLGRGQGEMEISGGSQVSVKGAGIFIGRSVGGTMSDSLQTADLDMYKDYNPDTNPCSIFKASPSVHSPTGILSLTKGSLYVHANRQGGGYGNYHMSGLVVGDGSTVTGDVDRLVYGKLTVNGGNVTNEEGHLLVGVGKATGVLDLKSGTLFKGQALNTQGGVHGINVIGVGGGDGTWLISGGSATIEGNLFVGGATSNDFCEVIKIEECPMSRYRDGKGLVSLSGTGRLDVKIGWNGHSVGPDGLPYASDDRTMGYPTQGLWLGRDGEGTLELIGSRCSFSADRNLTVTNGYTFSEMNRRTDGRGTIRFVADSDGLAQVKVGKELRLAPNARLEVDVRAYEGKVKEFKIIDCATRVGAFDPQNVTVKGSAVVLQNKKTAQGADDPDIYVRMEPGLLLIFR